jgi:hypothetical protein
MVSRVTDSQLDVDAELRSLAHCRSPLWPAELQVKTQGTEVRSRVFAARLRLKGKLVG